MPQEKTRISLSQDIFNINSEQQFEKLALDVFRYQHKNNALYQQWCGFLSKNPDTVKRVEEIPFLPIQFFKKNVVSCEEVKEHFIVFTSSSTTSQTPSRHYVKDIALYEQSFEKAFRLFYGEPSEYCILALLPNYLQRSGSSLVYMCDKLIKQSVDSRSGFFLDNLKELKQIIDQIKAEEKKCLLIGVSYALLDLASTGITLSDNFIVMETGGMKGRRKEMLKEELHRELSEKFKIEKIHSEYGMTELLSQAYSKGDGLFSSPPWMKFFIREVTDPLNFLQSGKTGGINVIDLANLHSCSFIATQDLGKLNSDGLLSIMGRYDHSDVRGCNLMIG